MVCTDTVDDSLYPPGNKFVLVIVLYITRLSCTLRHCHFIVLYITLSSGDLSVANTYSLVSHWSCYNTPAKTSPEYIMATLFPKSMRKIGRRSVEQDL